MQEQEKEIFQQYEIKNWNYSPRLYKIFGAAAVFNLLALFVMGQTDMLTTRGCDSPMVSRVCQVIDTIYIGSVLLGEDSEFVSKDYEKTVLEDAEITYIDVSGEAPPLTYPEGYFALANPESQFAVMENPMSDFPMTGSYPGFPSNPTISSGIDLMNTPQVTPTPNNSAIQGKIPTEPFSYGDNPTTSVTPLRNRKFPKSVTPRPGKNNASPNKLPPLPGDTTAKNKNDDKETDAKQGEIKSEPVGDIEINKKPFEDLGDSINDKIAKKEIDLSKPFLVILDGTIAADGTLDRKKSRYVKSDGDEKMVDVAKEVIQAVGDSKFLNYLKANGVDRVNFTLVQDDKQIYIKIVSDQKNPERAGTTASGLNSMLSIAKLADANGFKKLDENSKTLIENSKVTSEGKNFILNFAIPKQDAQDIITRELKKRAEKRAAEQPNGNAEVNRNINANLGK